MVTPGACMLMDTFKVFEGSAHPLAFMDHEVLSLPKLDLLMMLSSRGWTGTKDFYKYDAYLFAAPKAIFVISW